MARMTLQDFEDELIQRGFAALDQEQRYRYINWGYHAIARRFVYSWLKTSYSVTLARGEAYQVISGLSPDIPNFRSVERMAITTDPYRAALTPMSEERFFEQWYPLDLTNSAYWGTPTEYYQWEDKLYMLPPPTNAMNVLVHYTQRVVELANPNDTPITPAHLDEAIVLAALQRAHLRVQEVGLAGVAEAQLQEIFDDMQMDEAFTMEEMQERVSPDNRWL